ncbi:hypothetical protein JCM18904_1698 [Vibrio sp. JCM 18904]|nr:hypothetical protein C408_0644 [Vibrio diabolicus E0666]GAJ70963.1 hypothetical protein JCM18904_1698 [Vibrio sp. JCM 18904]
MVRVIKSLYSMHTTTVPTIAISMRERSSHLRSIDLDDVFDRFEAVIAAFLLTAEDMRFTY